MVIIYVIAAVLVLCRLLLNRATFELHCCIEAGKPRVTMKMSAFARLLVYSFERKGTTESKLMFFGIPVWPREKNRKKNEKSGKSSAAAERKKRKNSLSAISDLISILPDTLNGLMRAFRIDRLSAAIVWGSEDPAVTGQITGVVNTVAARLPDPVDLKLIPVFGERRLAGEADLIFKLFPLRIMGSVFRSGLKLVIRKIKRVLE